ncbi:hypothetical protein AZE42_14017 [Rhizopogon vesiculosus]|uniref:Uncharacterized protein n=1 Tax=Rhizopogon vesiculosus TaxID=180088 RepID=A0A1J8Q3Y6_9AGAM|nr:hypothetical protein AZE42_14017 [Rhizopogon vesiculosus]
MAQWQGCRWLCVWLL